MEFKHFTKDAISFLNDIARNNNKDWFEANRSRYESGLLAQSKAYVETMGQILSKKIPDIKAVPKIDGSIFRLYKDARYHKGAPFKTHQGIILWEGGSRIESSGFYLHIEPPFYSAGVGAARFSPDVLAEYRKSVMHPKLGREIIDIVGKAHKKGYVTGGNKRKMLPRGFKADGEAAELLLYDSLYLSDDTPINADFYSDVFMDRITEIFFDMVPFHKWLNGVIERAANSAKKEK